MLSAILLMFIQCSKNYRFRVFFGLAWFLYDLFFAMFFNFNLLFFSINCTVVTFITCLFDITKKFCNERVVIAFSVLSILVYSLLIDLICYYTIGCLVKQSLLEYIVNGLLFNLKYVYINIVVMIVYTTAIRVLKKYNFIIKIKCYLKNLDILRSGF